MAEAGSEISVGLFDDLRALVDDLRMLATAGGASTEPLDGSDEERIGGLLSAASAWISESAEPAPDALDLLCATYSLTLFERRALVAAMAPSLDSRFASVYGRLNGNPERPLLTIGLLLDLAGLNPWDPLARQQLGQRSTLLSSGLVREAQEAPFHARSLTVPDRVLHHVLGIDEMTYELERCAVDVIGVAHAAGRAIVRLLESGNWNVYLCDPGGAAPAIAHHALRSLDIATLIVDLTRVGDSSTRSIIGEARLEAALRRHALVIGPIDAIAEDQRVALDALSDAEVPVIIHGRATWNPSWVREPPAQLLIDALDSEQRHLVWEEAFAVAGVDLDAVAPASIYHLSPPDVVDAVRIASLHAIAADTEVDADAIARGVRSQNTVALERLARRITPTAGLDDVVLPERALRQLRSLMAWASARDRLIEEFGTSRRGTKGRGLTGLFVGPSGTGKTLAAEVVAGELGLDLYVIDLSTVVSKYIGETEENLDKVFREATGINGVLFFDEADALFGKRSGVRDSKDRYANMEVAYLLQRMEQFDGISLLASNLRANLDEAFTRRIDMIVTFPAPEPAERELIWEAHLPGGPRRGDDVDLAELAERFALSGGEIANVARVSAHAALAADGPVTMRMVIDAVAHEYDKIGRLVRPDDFGDWLEQLDR